ncbi:MAG: hypothetical protein KJO07_11545, partial [Deltaproteobacteria bacterium]|nr:hypothetical protein [Deltaproteobacteria bacterium]
PNLDRGIGSKVQLQVGAPDEPIEDDDAVPDPELGENDLFDLVSFSMLMAAPRPDEPSDESEHGRALFEEANCSGCHIPALRAPRGMIPAYTDLLVHDMGPELDDGIRMGVATGSEFRTAPLWGVAATGPWLHDGRADTLDEAIRLHGGEAEDSRDFYQALDSDEQSAVLAFLASLGGSSQLTGGRLAPDAPVPEVGDYGGPVAALTDEEANRFIRGRVLFDRDTPISGGLGPRFNGDSCRACHFAPVIGGAGPADVDVTRHARVENGGAVYVEPAQGTMAHRFETAFNVRPPFDPDANFIERRQTPSLLGLGLIERIPRASIEALADPTDENDDDVRGRVHILPGDRLGRFGWKADVPSLEEFIRDAMGAELGVTVPVAEGLTFGMVSDDDGVADPEIDFDDLADILFYMRSLAPPPRTSTRPEAEARGETLFGQVGCAACHVPELRTDDDRPVRLYSDLLLHDVASDGALGLRSGDADLREFRTAPLWGLAHSGPYMHDGRAETVEAAILAHDGEAARIRDAYLDLDSAKKDDLLAFLRSL